jgi:DNA-directed RNA polymerase specialized sigma24 family protein
VQDCWYRILDKIHTYSSKKSKFTTWSYHVCRSVLSRTYRKSLKYSERYVELDQTLYIGVARADLVWHSVGSATEAGPMVALVGNT